MTLSKKLGVLAIAGLSAFSVMPAFADEAGTTIDVSFWDKPDMDMATGLGHGMGGDMSKASMGFTLSTAEVPAGEVTFNGTNTSTDLVHEMIVAKLTSPDEVLPYDNANEEVDEDAAGAIGEISELDPGQSGSLTLHLDPGQYILFCNIPGHYIDGMWTVLTVS